MTDQDCRSGVKCQLRRRGSVSSDPGERVLSWLESEMMCSQWGSGYGILSDDASSDNDLILDAIDIDDQSELNSVHSEVLVFNEKNPTKGSIREAFRHLSPSFPLHSVDFILDNAWAPKTVISYDNMSKRLYAWMEANGEDWKDLNRSKCVLFLATLVHKPAVLGLAKTVTSMFLDIMSEGDRLSSLLLRAAKRANPKNPKYSSIWDIKTLVQCCKRQGGPESLALEALRDKSIVLIRMASALRAVDVEKIRLLQLSSESVSYRIMNPKSGKGLVSYGPTRSIPALVDSRESCVVCHLNEYVARMSLSMDSPLFWSLDGGKPLGVQAIGNISKKMMRLAGIPEKFGSHSIRHAAISALTKAGFSSEDVCRTAQVSEGVMRKYYVKMIEGFPIEWAGIGTTEAILE